MAFYHLRISLIRFPSTNSFGCEAGFSHLVIVVLSRYVMEIVRNEIRRKFVNLSVRRLVKLNRGIDWADDSEWAFNTLS